MRKKNIQLTESQLNRIVLNTAKRIIRESSGSDDSQLKTLYMYYEKLMSRIQKCNQIMNRASNNTKKKYNQFLQGLQQGGAQNGGFAQQPVNKWDALRMAGAKDYMNQYTNGNFIPMPY